MGALCGKNAQNPDKMLKICADILCYSLTPIINLSITLSTYPDDCKKAEVSPVYKKKRPT